MTQLPRVAIVGFSAFERSTLESFFRLCTPAVELAYDPSALGGCDVVVADADQPAAIYAVGRAGRVRDTVFVGGPSAPMSAGAHLARPVDALQIKRSLDALLEQRQRRMPAGAAGSAGAAARSHRPSGRARQLAADTQAVVQDFHGSSGFSNSVLVEGESRLDEVLVVSGSPAERRLLRDLLARYGYRVSLALNAETAVEMCEHTTFGFVFLGLGQDGLDSFQACRHIKRRPTLTGLAPVVVALAQRHGAIDRIRATFAGCDAYLTAPLDEDDLLRVLARHDPTFERVFEPTAPLPV